MGDRYNILSQMEHLQSKYMGTGHADTTKFEWATNQHRYTPSSIVFIGITNKIVLGVHIFLENHSPHSPLFKKMYYLNFGKEVNFYVNSIKKDEKRSF